MKKSILQQDKCAIPPQLILSNMHRGYPILTQISNCVKYLRSLQGTKIYIHVVRERVRKCVYNPTGDLNREFFFGIKMVKTVIPTLEKERTLTRLLSVSLVFRLS
ncbi:hypothetical protein PHMEG_00028119 [Phytophthora megakarya]|uniref:Uncharacterized protein n=1 Tax=Phytophthora megakarya TaxID=4795 RepID=A0A225V415_9STRA|nr:hypothetical protein PHMEG_00028119 [Phytophthora megakarya]